jgi:hypothetical protein
MEIVHLFGQVKISIDSFIQEKFIEYRVIMSIFRVGIVILNSIQSMT